MNSVILDKYCIISIYLQFINHNIINDGAEINYILLKGVFMKISKVEEFNKIFDKITNSHWIHEGVILIENSNGDFSYSKSYCGKEVESSLLMASITKLFTTTCILVLLEQRKLSFEDKITKYFDSDILSSLHVYNGKEYSFDITLYDLIFQTSGLPDVFEEGKDSIKKQVIKKDLYFEFNDMVARIKTLKPHFVPRSNGRSYYADINFDILGEIIEKVNGTTLKEAYEQLIFTPLGLKHTFLIENENDSVPDIYYKDTILKRPKYISSCRASGGAITTASEMMIFIKAFFNGELFNKSIFDMLSTYNRLQFSMGPIRYGGGYMQIPLKGLMTIFSGKGELIGHSGSTGSFAFYYPQKDLFFVGDLNQIVNPSLPIRLLMRLAMKSK